MNLEEATIQALQGKLVESNIREFEEGSEEYNILQAFCDKINKQYGGEYLEVRDTYFDYGQGWRWTTIIVDIDGSYQITPTEQEAVLRGTTNKFERELADQFKKAGIEPVGETIAEPDLDGDLKEVLKDINDSYDKEVGITDADVEMVKHAIEIIEETRTNKNIQPGDRIICDHYGTEVTDAVYDGRGVLTGYVPFVDVSRGKVDINVSGSGCNVDLNNLEFVKSEKRMFTLWGHEGARGNGAIDFPATVNIWKEKEVQKEVESKEVVKDTKQLSKEQMNEFTDIYYKYYDEDGGFKSIKDVRDFIEDDILYHKEHGGTSSFTLKDASALFEFIKDLQKADAKNDIEE